MKIKFTLLVSMALFGGAAHAAVTDIAQVPVLNIKGTGAVKPNLVLLYDNSGSMDFDYTPDIIARSGSGGNSNICRGEGKLSATRLNCDTGHPPFASADFNKQYYNPAVRYTPPVKADGTSFVLSDYGIGSPWTAVRVDPFRSSTTTSLLQYEDLEFCAATAPGVTPAGVDYTNCKRNTTTYKYPTNEYRFPNPTMVKGNPYYYLIKVAEYCTDATLTVCTPVTPGGAAPANYPVPAKVRWCDNISLETTGCQAKTDNAHIYPRFFASSGGTWSFSTMTINASASDDPAVINSVSINEVSGLVNILNGVVSAPSGTLNATPRAEFVARLAVSIAAKTGLAKQYTACISTPILGAKGCSDFGITLGSKDQLAIIPLDCAAGVTDKSQCTAPVETATWTPLVDAPLVPTTALLTLSGSTNKNFVLTQVKMGTVNLFSSNLTYAAVSSASTVAAGIRDKVNARNISIKAYLAPNAITPACAAAAAGTVCLVNTTSSVNGAVIALGNFTNQGSLNIRVSDSDGGNQLSAISTPVAFGGDTFVRVDITSGTVYTRYPDRSDCAGASSCTYTEEMNNFATWYAFYRTRDLMMKTAVGQAFAPVSNRYRVGLSLMREAANSSITGNPYVNNAMVLKPNTFEGTHRTSFYTKLYASSPSGGTPMRDAFHKTATAFKKDPTVVTELCQANFILATTDGYWNGAQAAEVEDNDNVENPARFCTKAGGCVDSVGLNPGSNTLSDVALYWYNGGSNSAPVSLSDTLGEKMNVDGMVPGRKGENTHLHLNTYTLGLGVDGIMTYNPNYDKPNQNDDFSKILSGASGCPWTPGGTGVYNWPNANTSATTDQQSRVDDLWHAAVNGRGKYFSASVPEDVVRGVSEALNNMESTIGAAAAAATSTPNISQQDNQIFSDTFTTVKWYGELIAERINTIDGTLLPGQTWNTSKTLGTRVGAASDTRKIYMLNIDDDTLKPFKFESMAGNAAEISWFANRCPALAQCPLMNLGEKAVANLGLNLVNWLRGQQQFANDTIYRAYATSTASADSPSLPLVLGDIVSSKPAFLRDPRKGYTMAGYAEYKAAQTNPASPRKGMVFTAANDGMLHAFDAATGVEDWAYVPRIIMKKLAAQASTGYATSHQFTTDGSPDLGDVQIGGVWKTVLVAGLGAGGRGFYALDVTDPAAPKALWEMCADATVCTKHNNPNIGLTMGNAQFGMWNGKWVVFLTSGYNNVPGTDGVNTGDGQGHLFIVNVATGALEMDIVTTASGSTAGTTGTPSGLAKITAISLNPHTDPLITYVYGGDNLGQMWRFNPNGSGAAQKSVLMGSAGAAQPITTRPDIAMCVITTVDPQTQVSTTTTRRVALFGTGRLLALSDMANTTLQSMYLLKDVDLPAGNPISNIRGTTMVEQVLSPDSVDSSDYRVTTNAVDLSVKNGWWIDFDRNAGERVNLDPKIVNGVVTAVTNIPGESSACSVGGSSKIYHLSLCSGRAPGAAATPTGLPSNDIVGETLSPTSAAVGFIIVRLPSGQLKIISTLASGAKITTNPPGGSSAGARKVGWRRLQN